MARQVNNDQQLHLRLPAELAAAAQAKAQQQKRPLSDVVRDLLRTWCAEQPQPQPQK